MLSFSLPQRRLFSLLGAIFLSLLITKLMTFLPQWPIWVERNAQSVWALLASPELDARFVVVDIDENSLRRVGAWPWSREVMSQLSENILEKGASVLVVDAVFPDTRHGDQGFKKLLSGQQVVLAQIFSNDINNSKLANQGVLRGASLVPGCPLNGVVQSNSFLANTINLGQFPVGHISASVDQDGTIRHFPPLVCYEKQIYPSLMLAGLSALTGTSNSWRWARGNSWWGPDAWALSDDLPGIRIPMDKQGLVRLSFLRKRSSYSAISAYEVLDKSSRISFDGAIVILGASAFGLADSIPTPLSGLSTGMEVHLQIGSALLDQQFTFTPQLAWLIPVLLGGLVSLLMIFWVLKTNKKAAWIIGFACLFALMEWSLFVLGVKFLSWWIPPLALMIYTTSLGILLVIYAYRKSSQDKNLISQHLASFIDPDVAKDLEHRTLSSEALIEQRSITVLVIDIQGFTHYLEKHTTEINTNLLQTFFLVTTNFAQKHGGVVDNLIGDAVMILFNANGFCPSHANAALDCAADVANWSKGYLEDPSRQLNVAMGISTGLAMVGQLGSKVRRTHTAIGIVVSKAFRFEKLCRDLKQRIIVSQETMVAALGQDYLETSEVLNTKGVSYRYYGEVPLRGFSGVFKVYVA